MNKNTTLKTSDYVDENGKFKTGNNGRPKGATNKTTRELKQFITNFLNEKTSEIFEIWDSLDDKEKATLFLHLSKLVMPRNEVNEDEQKNIRLLNIDPLDDTPQIIFTKPEQVIEYSKKLDEMY
jgi:hypothetical protein